MEAKGLSTVEKDGVAREIATRLGVDYQSLLNRRILQIVSMEEARQIWRAGWICSCIRTGIARLETASFFNERFATTATAYSRSPGDEPPAHFCYPSGHHLPEFLPWLRELGVKSATTCEPGLARRGSDDLVLPRVLDDSTVDPVRFESIVSGLFM